MFHARDDYNRIQDPAGKIPADEPVFLIRGSDPTAPAVVQYWADLNRTREGGEGDNTLADLAVQQVQRMRAWQEKHGSKKADL